MHYAESSCMIYINVFCASCFISGEPVTTMHVAGTYGAATVYADFRNGTIPFARCPCLSSSVYHAACIKRAGLDLIQMAT